MGVTTVATAACATTVPEFWTERGWDLPFHFLTAIDRPSHRSLRTYDYLDDTVVSGFDARRVMSRRSLMATSEAPVPATTLNAILRRVYRVLRSEADLFCGVVTSGVESWKDAVWLVEHQPRSLVLAPGDPHSFTRLIQGQQWGDGNGIVLLVGIDWTALEPNCDENQAYADALVAVGRAGQALVCEAAHFGLVGRMTPAVHESTAAEMLGLPDYRDVLYALRLALPR